MRLSNSYKKRHQKENIETLVGKYKTITGLDRNFYYNLVKSKIAETIVQNLFLLDGYKVHKYGMESSIPQILGSLNFDNSDTARHIRSMPDFVVQSPDNENVFFIEVKFRENGKFSFSDLNVNSEYPYKSAYFIIMSKTCIKCLSYNQLLHGYYIDEITDNNLIDRKEFSLSKDVYVEYLGMMKDLFCNM